MTTVPLARNDGMTTWILVDKHSQPDQRQIFCSCETFRKRALTADSDGVHESIVHGIASVFCAPQYRGRGFAKFMMRQLAQELYTWQSNGQSVVGTILYSDIGKKYYAQLGWQPNTTNSHVEFKPQRIAPSTLVKTIHAEDIAALCERDEILLRKTLAEPAQETRVAIIPDVDHVGWHLGKESYTCKYLFGKEPQDKGAIAGSPGSQVWAIWTRRYYERPDVDSPHNVLYILRLVMEQDETATRIPADAEKNPMAGMYEEQMSYLKAVLQTAQAEAAEWKLDAVELWDPTPLVQRMLAQMDIEYKMVERNEESIASLLWYNDQGGKSAVLPLWVNNEHYAWC